MNIVVLVIEIVIIAALIGVNIWIAVRKKASVARKNIEGLQKREYDLNQMIANQAGESANSKLRPFEEKYASETRDTGTMDGGLRVELKVNTPVSEKKYLTTITDRLSLGTDPTNELILDSSMVAPREALLVRDKSSLMFVKQNPMNAVYVERSRSRKTLGDKPFKVHSQDKFYLQDVVLEIRFV